MKKIISALTVMLTAAVLFAGCSPIILREVKFTKPSPTLKNSPSQAAADGPLAAADVAYAEPLVDNMLAGLRDKDYAVFSRDFSDMMKSAMNEDAMRSLADFLAPKIGEYESRTFGQAAKTTLKSVQYTMIIYTAKYSDEPGDVLVTVSFNAVKKIEGLNFNSPKLRQQ